MRRRALPVVLALLTALVTAGCGDDSAPGGTLSMGTGNSTGVYAVLGRGLASLVGQKMPGYQVTAEVTGGSKENIDRIVAGEDDIGFSSLSWASDAITGQGAFSRPQPIRAVARLYLNYVQVIVRADITDLRDLKDKSISTGSPGSTGELAAARLLTFAGLDVDRDTHRQKASLDKSVELMKAGDLDAIFWSGGLPTSGVQDLLRTLGTKATLLDLGGYYQRMSVQYPDVYEEVSINPAGYGLAKPIRTIAEPNLLLVNDAMPEDLARQLTGTLMGNLPQLASVHPEGRNITRAAAPVTDPIPLHSGALHWYRDNPGG
jgi:TRAP transporter TAXI family solute receptor